jgi:hypothetical protein
MISGRGCVPGFLSALACFGSRVGKPFLRQVRGAATCIDLVINGQSALVACAALFLGCQSLSLTIGQPSVFHALPEPRPPNEHDALEKPEGDGYLGFAALAPAWP